MLGFWIAKLNEELRYRLDIMILFSLLYTWGVLCPCLEYLYLASESLKAAYRLMMSALSA